MKLSHVLFLTFVVIGTFAGKGGNEGRTEEETEIQKEWKKECKKGIKNKEESDKFKEKMNKCMDKKLRKHEKREEKAQKRADRVVMKSNVNELKEEKTAIKAERNLCKARCNQLANQKTKQNCLDYWKTLSREDIENVLGQIGDLKGNDAEVRGANDDHCLTDAGLTGTESTCKDVAVNFCENLNLPKPSPSIRQCKSSCINSCMEGFECAWDSGR